MKFVTFLKIFAISIASLVGVFAIGYGIMVAVGYFDEPDIYPTSISFEFSEYNVDGDFTAKVITNTQDVTKLEIELSFAQGSNVTEKNGVLTDGVISIPKNVKIGQEFEISVVKNTNDAECDGLSWIAGGHSVIRATSPNNANCESAKTNVNVDVPAYRVELITSTSSINEDEDVFVVNSSFNTYLKFYPQRSAYQYSFDGTNGYETKYKNAYFMMQSSNDENVAQVGTTNKFNTNKVSAVGDVSTIEGYAFASTPIEERILKLYEDKNEETKFAEIMSELKKMTSDVSSNVKSAVKAEKSVTVVDLTVDKMTVTGKVENAFVDTINTIYASKQVPQGELNSSNLGIKLSSTINESVSLQNKITNVGITFYYKQGNSYFNAINNENESYNIISLPKDGYSKTQIKTNQAGENITYYFPVMTDDYNDLYWQFSVLKSVDTESLVIEIVYFDDSVSIEPIRQSFSTNATVSNPISWNDLTPVELTIFDNIQDIDVNYEEYDLSNRIEVPSQNLYQTTRYFAYSNENLDNFIYCKTAVDYMLGTQTYSLYELENGVVKAKSLEAHGKSFRVIYVTIETDMFGSPKLDSNGKYIIDQYSQDEYGAVSSISVTVTKTLKSIDSQIELNGDIADYKFDENDQTNLAFVHNSTNPFDVVITYSGEQDDVEEAILKQAILDGNISIVAKTNGVETDIIQTVNVTEENLIDDNKTYYRFSLKIGSLATGLSEMKLNLYVRYKQSANTEYNDILVSSTKDDIQIGYIEVYDGHAVQFNFNINLNSNYKTSPTNRIDAKLEIELDDATGNIKDISNSYTLKNLDISEYLFVKRSDNTVDYTTLNIVLKDKHGRKPISSSYTLQSTSQNLVVTGTSSITFVGAGNAELNLIDAENQVRDTLYFTSQEAGQVVKVDKLVENVSSNIAKQTVKTEYEYIEGQTANYAFPQLTIPVVGYSGSTIWLNSTDKGNINLVEYMYRYQDSKTGEIKEVSLTPKMQFEIKDDSNYDDALPLISFDLTTETGKYIKFDKDFGQTKSLTIIASLPLLGISQTIVLSIKPNVTVKTSIVDTFVSNSNAVTNEIEVYADSVITLDVTVGYTVQTQVSDNSKYAFFATINNNKKAINSTETENVYIIDKDALFKDNTFSKVENETTTYQFQVKLVFNSQSTVQSFIISFEKSEDANKTNADSVSYLNLKVVPNVKASLTDTNQILYLNTQNGDNGIYGDYVIYGNDANNTYPINISRIVESTDDKYKDVYTINHSYINIVTDDENYTVEKQGDDFVLKCKTNLFETDTVMVSITYNGYNFARLTLKVAPNIQMNTESTAWVKFDGKYYLSFKDGQSVTLNELQTNYFSYDNGQQLSFEFTPESNNLVYDGATLQVVGASNKILGTDNSLYVNVKLGNGNSLTFNILILPFDLPFTVYRENGKIDGEIIEIDDLKDALDVEYLKENYLTYYFEYSGADENGLPVSFELEEGSVLPVDAIGIRKIDGANYYVRNLDENDVNTYARYENGNLIAEYVGKDVYVVLYANLDASSSESLIIPYLIKIKKELVVKTYYPYLSGESNNDDEIIGGDLIANNPTFEMEYLSFDEQKTATLNMNELLGETIPNKSPLNNKRFSIGRNVDGVFEIVEQSSITFAVKELYYYYYGWKQANVGNISNYATVNDSIISIKSNNAEKIRLKIEISTRSGVNGWYYVSVGEIPNMSFTQLKNGVNDPNIEDITINATNPYNLDVYKLTKLTNNVTEDITNELCFFILNQSDNISIDLENKQILTKDSTKNWETKLLFYTKYGALKIVNIEVLSNFVVETNLKDVYSGSTINILDQFTAREINGGVSPTIESIESIEIVNKQDNNFDSFVFINQDDLSKIYLGLTDTKVSPTFKIVFNLKSGEDLFTYSGEYTINVLPRIEKANKNNSQDNQYHFGSITAGSQVSGETYSFDKLYKYIGDGDFITWLSDENNNVNIEFTMVSTNVQGKENYNVSLQDGNLVISVPKVASKTDVSYKAVIKNTYQSTQFTVYEMYFMFTVEPTFTLSINYPQPNSNESDFLDREYIYLSEDETTIAFNENAIFSSNNRVEVTQSEENNIYIGVKSDYIKECTLEEAEPKKQLSNSEFTIDRTKLVGNVDDIIFTIYYKVSDDAFVPVSSYTVQISKTSVISATAVNFLTENKQNSELNPEIIYIGTNDNITTKVNVSFKITEQSIIDQDMYIKFTSLGGIALRSDTQMLHIAPDMQGIQLDTYVILTTNENLVSNALVYELYTLNNDNYIKVDVENFEIYDINIKSRVGLTYAGKQVDFYKAYNIIDKDQLNVGATNEGKLTQNIVVNIGKQNLNVGTYHVNYMFDIAFDTQENIVLSTGQSTSILKRTIDSETDKNYSSIINMKKLSGDVYYTQNDFSKTTFTLKLGNIQGNTKGYLRSTAYTNADDTIYDYTFLAMGAPNEDVVVSLDITVTFNNLISKTYTFSFVIKNDYTDAMLYNHDKTVNSQVNRCLISTTAFLTMAKAGSTNPSENYIYIAHTNDIVGAVKGNVAPYFNILIDQGGQYVEKREQTDDFMDLVLRFSDIDFGNANVDLRFVDEYGYEFMFYITIVARYNPIYNGGTQTIYELDTVELVYDSASSNADVFLPIVFESRDEGTSVVDSNVLVSVKIKDQNGDFATNNSGVLQYNDKLFTVDLVDESYFDNGTSFSGFLNIEFYYNSSNTSKAIDVPIILKQRYYLQTVEEPTYVRDGVPYSLLDVVDIVDSKNSVSVGERYIENTNTAYIKYSLHKNTDQVQVSLDDLNESITLGIEAVNTVNNQSFRKPIVVENNEIYTDLNEMFDISTIDNYKFYLIYWPLDTSQTTSGYDYFKADDKKYEITKDVSGKSNVVEFTIQQDEGEVTYQIEILNSFIVDDINFVIGLRELTNNQFINIYFITQNSEKKTMQILSNVNEQVKYSLYENGVISNGQKVSLYTSEDRTYINGMSNDDLARLKGIKFNGVQNYTMTSNMLDDGEFEYGTYVYQNGELNVNVSYGLQNGQYLKQKIFTAPIRITLKYVEINTILAYGSGTLRFVDDYSNNEINIQNWAGTTSRPFTLVTGYTNATSSYANEDLKLSSHANNQVITENNDLAFAINTAQSSEGSSNVTIDEDGTIRLPNDYDINNSYIAIDVKVKYGTGVYSKLIGTVLIAPREIYPTKVTLKTNKLLYTVSDTQKQVSYDNIIKLINVTDDNGNSINSESLTNQLLIYINDQQISSGSQVKINEDSCSLKVTIKEISQTFTFDNIVLTNIEFEEGSLITSDSYNFYYDTTSIPSQDGVYKNIINNVIFKNIYNENITANVRFSQILSEDNNGYICDVQIGTASNGQSNVYIYTFKYSDITLGVVTVNVYDGNNKTIQLSTTLTNDENKAGVKLSNFYDGSMDLYELRTNESDNEETEPTINKKTIKLNFNSLIVRGYKNITSSTDGQNYHYIDVGDFDIKGDISIFTDNQNLSVDDIYITTVIIEESEKNVLVIADQVINNIIIHLYNNDNDLAFTFVYINEEDLSDNANNIYDLISILYNIEDTSKLSVRLSSDKPDIDEYVSLKYTSQNVYEITILKPLNSGDKFTLEIYNSIMDNLSGQVKEIVYYSKTFTV